MLQLFAFLKILSLSVQLNFKQQLRFTVLLNITQLPAFLNPSHTFAPRPINKCINKFKDEMPMFEVLVPRHYEKAETKQ